MKITDVTTAASEGHGMHLWVKVETDAGITGIGECVHGEKQVIAILHDLRRQLIGRDPFAIDAIFEELRRAQVFNGGFAGALITALTGLDLALWDLKGKALGVPVYELLGGKFRDRIRVYADCQVDPRTPLDEVDAFAEGVLERGFSALKIDVDGGDAPHKDCEEFSLMWLEEPVPPENVAAMRAVKAASTTPICAGENLYLRHGFRELIETQAVDIIMPDIPKCGGLSECRKIANQAELYYLPFAPHNVASPIGTMASAHVCASVPNFLIIEFHWMHRDYWTTIVDDKRDIIQDGYIAMSDRPGIGVDLDEAVAKQYQVPGTTWFEPS